MTETQYAQEKTEALRALKYLKALKEQLPPEAKVRGSNPLGRATFKKIGLKN
jgi:hypothetical protein